MLRLTLGLSKAQQVVAPYLTLINARGGGGAIILLCRKIKLLRLTQNLFKAQQFVAPYTRLKWAKKSKLQGSVEKKILELKKTFGRPYNLT